jgi:hypothetical protein
MPPELRVVSGHRQESRPVAGVNHASVDQVALDGTEALEQAALDVDLLTIGNGEGAAGAP